MLNTYPKPARCCVVIRSLINYICIAPVLIGLAIIAIYLCLWYLVANNYIPAPLNNDPQAAPVPVVAFFYFILGVALISLPVLFAFLIHSCCVQTRMLLKDLVKTVQQDLGVHDDHVRRAAKKRLI